MKARENAIERRNESKEKKRTGKAKWLNVFSKHCSITELQ